MINIIMTSKTENFFQERKDSPVNKKESKKESSLSFKEILDSEMKKL